MYKVITHTIREEHFNHPITANVALRGPNQVVDPFTTTSAMKYRDAARTAAYKWLASVRSYVTSTNAAETDVLKEEVKKSSMDLVTTLFNGYLQPAVLTNVTNAFESYYKAILSSIDAVKTKQDVPGARDRAKTAAEDLAMMLSRLSRSWPMAALEDSFVNIAKEFANQAEYRAANQYPADIASTTMTEGLLISGAQNGAQSLIDLVTKGIILLYSMRFR